MKKASNKVQKAKVKLLLNHPFFAQVILESRFFFTDSIPTMATDGKTIAANPEFVNNISIEEVQGVLAHEAMHVIGMHHLRMQSRDHSQWNDATDYAINDILINEGFKLPEGGLIDSQYAKKAAEEIYNILPKNENNNPSMGEVMQPGSLSGPDGKPLKNGDSYTENPVPLTQSEVKQEERRVKDLITKASTSAKMQGKMPGSLARMVDDIITTKTPWQDLLRKYMTKDSKNDYSWSVPNRRFIGQGLYLPSNHSLDSMGEIIVAIDTSGSIGDRELSTFQGQLKAIVRDTNPSSLTVVYFDTEVSSTTEFTSPSETDIILSPTGGGGTDFRPIFQWITDHQKEPECVVVLTDLYATAPPTEEYDTIWVALPGSAPDHPWGTRIDIEWEH